LKRRLFAFPRFNYDRVLRDIIYIVVEDVGRQQNFATCLDWIARLDQAGASVLELLTDTATDRAVSNVSIVG
jgi:hypothetical protein